MAITKDVFVWTNADLSTELLGAAAGTSFTVTGSPDLMTFSDDEADTIPSDFNPIDNDQTLSGTLDGVQFTGNTASEDTFEFEIAYQVTDGTNTFNVYAIDNGSNGGSQVAYVSEMPLDPEATYTVVQIDPSVNFDNPSIAAEDEATPIYTDLAGPVQGDSGDNTMGVGYVDADTDIIDGADGDNDVILGGGGGDTIQAGDGNDLVYGDHEDEHLPGTSEYVVQGYIKDQNFELTADHLSSSGATKLAINSDPVEIRIIDNDSRADSDAAINETPSDTDQLIEINGVLFNFSADYQVEFLGSDGNTYTMMVVDVDRDHDGTFDDYSPTSDAGDKAYDDGQVLLPVGTPPPAGVTLTSLNTGVTLISDPDYTTLYGGDEITNFDDDIDAGAGNDTIYAGRGSDTVDGGDGDDLIVGDGDTVFDATDPDAMIWTPGESVQFSYSAGDDLGNGGSGGTNHIASADASSVSNLSVFLPDGDWDVNAGDTIGFSFTDENGQIITVQSGTVQQTAFSQGTDDTGVLTAQGVDQFGNEVALLLKFTNNDGSSANPIITGNAFYDNDTDPDASNGTDVTLSESHLVSAFDGAGDDVLNGGAGDDSIIGGAGNDTFVEVAGDGADTISDFNFGNTGSLDDGDQSNNDFVDLESFYTRDAKEQIEALGTDTFVNKIDMLRQDAADGHLDGVINGTDYSSIISGIDLTLENDGTAVTGADLTYDNTNVICFVRGVRIATARGEIPVETLSIGDRVITRDRGYQEIRWIGSTTREAKGKLAPILFKAGSCLGNTADIMVSPNHRMLAKGGGVELVSGAPEALVPAKFMINGNDILQMEGASVEYFHILFDHHELVWSEGCWSESFHPGEMGWNTLCEATRQEILDLFPNLGEMFSTGYDVTARQVLDRKQAIAALSIHL
ncbi:MAG: hypothetical protein GYB25_02010 [Rhodobacteraceae bacterium]|nr:hypothetical protein [Paracoccaceae bacterium]